MSDNEATNAGDGKDGMSAADVSFLVTCLQNTTAGSISIDCSAVAGILNYANSRSVSNRINRLKKKHNLPFGTSGATRYGSVKEATSKKKASDDEDGPAEVEVPKTPSKERITKSKAASKTKATPKAKAEAKSPKAKPERKPRGKKAVKAETEDDGAVKEPTLEEEVFGNPDSDDSGLSDAPEDEA